MLSNYVQKIKEYWQNLQSGTKKVILTVVPLTILVVIVSVVALGYAGKANYSVLFSDLTTDEAQEVVSLLQADGVTYRYGSNGDIMVPKDQEDQIRANLLYEGFRLDGGFTYDMYINNTGLMTTESDKKQYTLYDLQDRLAAQIRLFSGVQDAKVTIVQQEEKLYALSSYDGTEASASVVVTMKKGYDLTEKHASAIKTLVEHAVKGMTFTSVAVLDANTMLEVGGEGNSGTYGEGESMLALTTLVETNIANNIRRVLEQLYDSDKIAISVKGTLNMEKLIQENITYSVPSQSDEEDRSGLLYSETASNEASGSAALNSGGVAGADANADVPIYNTEDEDGVTTDSYINNSATREWLFNTLTEQREVSPGVLENATVAIVINTENKNVKDADLLKLVANAAGISLETAEDQITIVRSMGDNVVVEDGILNVSGTAEQSIPWLLVLAIVAGILLVLLLLAVLLLRKKSSKKAEEDEFGLDTVPTDPFADVPADTAATAVAGSAFDASTSPEAKRLIEENSEMNKNEEIINLRMQRSLKLKQNIGDFVDQNPQVAAKLLQGWLRGEGAENGGKQQQQG